MKKKAIIVLGVVIALVVVLGFMKLGEQPLETPPLDEENDVFYFSNHTNASWGFYVSKETIYNTGEITLYTNSNGKEEEKSAYLTSEELSTLKELAKKAKTKMVKGDVMAMDRGDTKSSLYQPETHKEIELYRFDAGYGYTNEDKDAQKCMEMIGEMFQKYIYETKDS